MGRTYEAFIATLCLGVQFHFIKILFTLVNPIIIVVYRSAGPDKSADFVMNCY